MSGFIGFGLFASASVCCSEPQGYGSILKKVWEWKTKMTYLTFAWTVYSNYAKGE